MPKYNATLESKRLELAKGFKPFHLNRLKKIRDVFASAQKIPGGYAMQIGDNKILFDIDILASSTASPDLDIVMRDEDYAKAAQKGCGTAACVVGTAGIIPEFRKAGLKTVVPTGTDTYVNDIVTLINPKTKEYIENRTNAFGVFFGVATDYPEYDEDMYGRWPGSACDYICMPDEYLDAEGAEVIPTPADVVRRLNVLIKKGEAKLKKAK